MKPIFYRRLIAAAMLAAVATSCVKEVDPYVNVTGDIYNDSTGDTPIDNPSFSGSSDSVSTSFSDYSGDSLRCTMFFEYSGNRWDGFMGYPVLVVSGNANAQALRVTRAMFNLDGIDLAPIIDNAGLTERNVGAMVELSEGTHVLAARFSVRDANGIPHLLPAELEFKIGEQEPEVVSGKVVAYRWNVDGDMAELSLEYTGNLQDGFSVTPVVKGKTANPRDSVLYKFVLDGRFFQQKLYNVSTDSHTVRFNEFHAEAGRHYVSVNVDGGFSHLSWVAIGSTRNACWDVVDTSYFHSNSYIDNGALVDSVYMEAEVFGNVCTGVLLNFKTCTPLQSGHIKNIRLVIDGDTLFTFATIPAQLTTVPIDITSYGKGMHNLKFVWDLGRNGVPDGTWTNSRPIWL